MKKINIKKLAVIFPVVIIIAIAGCFNFVAGAWGLFPRGAANASELPQQESFLTVKKDVNVTLTNHMSYVSASLSGPVTIEMEVKLGATKNEFLGMGIYPNKTDSVFTSNGNRTVQFGGVNLRSFSKIDNVTKTTALDAKDCPYSDATGVYNFYHRMSIKLDVLANGNVDVSVKLTEDRENYTGTADYDTLTEYIKLYTFEDWYKPLLDGGNFYFGWSLATSKMEGNDVEMYRIQIKDVKNNLLFVDNFTDYNVESGRYVITTSVKNALTNGKLVVTQGAPVLIPYIDTSAVMASGYTNQEFDLTAQLVNFSDDAQMQIQVRNSQGEAVDAQEGGKYIFPSQGRYDVSYTISDQGINFEQTLTVFVKEHSLQRSVEENFNSGSFRDTDWVYSRAAVKDGVLHILSSAENAAYFATKHGAENFILTFDITGALEGTDSFYAVFGGAYELAYKLAFSRGSSEVTLKYPDGADDAVADIGMDVLGELAQNTVTVRIRVSGGNMDLYVITREQSGEQLEYKVASFDGIAFVGSTGVGVEDGGGVYIDDVQFVSLTDVLEDNTNKEVPEDKTPTDTTPPVTTDPIDQPGCGCAGEQSIMWGGLVIATLLAAAATAFSRRKSR